MAKVCTQINEWVEEEISKPIEEWEERQEEKCKKRKWYDPRKWLCWIVTTFVKVVRWIIVKVGKWVVKFVCRIISSVLNALLNVFRGIIIFFRGLFSGNWRMMLDGLTEILSGILSFAGIVILILLIFGLGLIGLILLGILVGADIVDYIIEEVNKDRLRKYVKGLVKNKYGKDEKIYNAISDALGLEHGAFGFRLMSTFLRGFLDSETKVGDNQDSNLIKLHDEGVDLKKLCGFENNEKWYTSGPRYQTVKTDVITGESSIDLGFGNTAGISKNELNEYIDSRGTSRIKFRIYCMSLGILNIKLNTASEKGRELGLMVNWEIGEVELKEKRFIDPYQVFHQDSLLTEVIGRKSGEDAVNELCNPVAVGMFSIIGFSGYTTTLKDTECEIKGARTSGVTIVDVQPDIFRKYVLMHEFGHYFGLCHVAGFDRMMVSGAEGEPSFWSWDAIPNFFLHSGPTFVLGEAKQVWRYIINYFPVDCLMKRHH